jgi:CelD/BcsL family acetyltransferase involved in cellulose biosynthesis
VRRADVYAGACDINAKAISGQRTIATAKIAEDALAASTSLFRLKLVAFKSLPETLEGLPSELTAAIP